MHFSEKKINQIINIAIFLLKTHKPEAICSLKDFLTIIPSSEKIQQVIITAINQLIETEPETIFWLLNNPHYLQPETDIKLIVTRKLNEKLFAWGFIPEDIHFNEDGNLEFNVVSKERLLSRNYSEDDNAVMTLIKSFLAEEI